MVNIKQHDSQEDSASARDRKRVMGTVSQYREYTPKSFCGHRLDEFTHEELLDFIGYLLETAKRETDQAKAHIDSALRGWRILL